MKIILMIAVVLTAVVVVVVVAGSLLPKQHTASRSIVIRKQPGEVYAVIRDFAAAPSWRKELKRVEILSPTQFREYADDAVTYDVVEDVPGRRLVTRIADTNLPYGGSWTYELQPAGEGTRLTITENGEVYNPIFRFVSRYVMGHSATIDRYLASLAKKF